MSGTGLRSPHGNELQRLDGHPGDISRRGVYLENLGATMESTALALDRISDGETQIAEAIEKLRESASEVHGDLSKAATRYARTGTVLRTYATALSTAQTGIHPLVPDIEDAHARLTTAQSAVDDAQDVVDDYERTWLWEDDPTDAQRTTAASDLSDAEGAVTAREGELAGLWTTFDRLFDTWSEAYESAADGIESAIAAADNNDNWFDDALDVFLDALSWIGMGLAIVALFVAAPFAAILFAIVAVIALVSLIGHLYLMTKGRATLTDVAFDLIGLIPFGKPAVAALRGASGARGALASFMRSITPGAGSAIAHGRRTLRDILFRNADEGSRRANQVFAAARTNELLSGVSRGPAWLWNTIRSGHRSTADLMDFASHLRTTVVPEIPGINRWVNSARVTTQVPTMGQSIQNVSGFIAGLDPAVAAVIPGYGGFRDQY